MDSPVLRQHALYPSNQRTLPSATARGESSYPPCGDRLILEILLENGSITQAGFHGTLCAPLVALGSLLTTKLQGLTPEQLATIGLTIPAVAVVSLATGWTLTLGIDVKSTVLLVLSLAVAR